MSQEGEEKLTNFLTQNIQTEKSDSKLNFQKQKIWNNYSTKGENSEAQVLDLLTFVDTLSFSDFPELLKEESDVGWHQPGKLKPKVEFHKRNSRNWLSSTQNEKSAKRKGTGAIKSSSLKTERRERCSWSPDFVFVFEILKFRILKSEKVQIFQTKNCEEDRRRMTAWKGWKSWGSRTLQNCETQFWNWTTLEVSFAGFWTALVKFTFVSRNVCLQTFSLWLLEFRCYASVFSLFSRCGNLLASNRSKHQKQTLKTKKHAQFQYCQLKEVSGLNFLSHFCDLGLLNLNFWVVFSFKQRALVLEWSLQQKAAKKIGRQFADEYWWSLVERDRVYHLLQPLFSASLVKFDFSIVLPFNWRFAGNEWNWLKGPNHSW